MENVFVPRRPVCRPPTHPGALLRDTVLPATGLTVTAFASRLNVTRQQLHRILAEQAGISPEMALRLGKFCGNGETLWLRMQQAFDVWHANRKLKKELEAIRPIEIAEAPMA